MTEKTQHKAVLEEWLGSHARRRAQDYEYFVGPKTVIWQFLIRMEALWKCLNLLERKRGVGLKDAKILDVGSSYGGDGLAKLMSLSFSSRQLYGIDIMEDRISRGREMYPGLNLFCGDATNMECFTDNQFDVVMESFCFCHIAEDEVRQKIAREMIRVVKPGGHILVFDWVYGSEHRNINALPLRKIKSMFEVGARTVLVRRFPGQLIPPVGRAVSGLTPALYPLVQRLAPPLVGSKLTVLSRTK